MLTPEKIEKIMDWSDKNFKWGETAVPLIPIRYKFSLIQAGYNARDKEALELKTDAHGHNPREIKLPPNPFKEALELQDEEMLLNDIQMVDIVRPITAPSILEEVDKNAESRAIFTSEYHAIAYAQLQKVQPTITVLKAEVERVRQRNKDLEKARDAAIELGVQAVEQAKKEERERIVVLLSNLNASKMDKIVYGGCREIREALKSK